MRQDVEQLLLLLYKGDDQMSGASCACDNWSGDAGNLPGSNPCASNADTLLGTEELLLLDATMLLD